MTVRTSNEKTFEQFMEEALLKLPLYCKEWTNFNKSDPGITMLENLSAFAVLQQSYISEETDEIKEALLKIAGFTRKESSCAKILLMARNVVDNFVIPINQQFMVGDMIVESERAVEVSGGQITGIVLKHGGDNETEYPELLKDEPQFASVVFSEKPTKGMELWLFMDDIPKEETELIFYVKTLNEFGRNPKESTKDRTIEFAKIRWQCYTEQGFLDIPAKDETDCFIFDGTLTFSLFGIKPQRYQKEGNREYVIRGILELAEYDISPRLLKITGFLFEVSQKETKSFVKRYENTDSVSTYSDILEEEYFKLYRRETGEEGFRLCGVEDYKICHDGYGMYTFRMDKEYEMVILTAYTEEMIHNYRLGTIYGYDRERIRLPKNHIVSKNFSLIVEDNDREDGESRYYFLSPGVRNTGGFLYSVDEENGIITILEGGDFIGCSVYLGELVISEGEKGNILPLKEFIPTGYETEVKFINPVQGYGGRFRESLESLMLRYFKDVNQVHTAVTATDFERLIKEIPGLCIDKVKAYRHKGEQGKVYIAVKPGGPKSQPGLSGQYRRMIMEVIEDKRLLGVGVTLVSPVYLPVHVQGRIYVKGNYEEPESIIRNEIIIHLDYIHSNKNFGELLEFDKVFEAVERLECVEAVGDFSIRPGNLKYAEMEGADIRPDNNCLIYPGDIRIETDYMRQ